jgi:HAE1 family hydrophobic/amphiphilic exporter-1
VSLSSLAVRRGVTFTMIYLIVVGSGAYGLSQLRIDMWPDITFPMVTVVATYEGASPEDIETVVTRPIEEAVATVENVEHVMSESKDGAASVSVELAWGTDVDEAEREIRKNLDLIANYLPPDLDEPLVFSFDPSMQPILLLAVSGPFSQAELRHICEHLVEPRLERIEGVAQVNTAGGLEREIQVRLLPERMRDYDISTRAVVGALQMNNLRIPGGQVVEQGREFQIQNMGQFESVEQIRELVVGVREPEGLGAPVPIKLRAVADVVDGFKEPTRIIRHNDKPGVMLIVRKQTGANSVQACNNVERQLDDLIGTLPPGLVIRPVFNQSDFIEQSIGNLSNTAMMAFVLAFFVLLLFLWNFRAALTVATAIPISVVATFVVMDAVDITLNIISLAGLALAVGLLVDNSIVVLENIFRHLEAGEQRRAAAVTGAREVGMAITASTLTTVAVFAPVLFVPGIAGMMFRDMAITICCSLAVSLIIALTLVPLMASRIVRVDASRQNGGDSSDDERLARARGGFAVLQRFYGGILRWSLRHRWSTLGLATLLMGGSLAATVTVIKVDFFSQQDSGIILYQADAMVGTSLEKTDALFRRAEELVEREVPEATDIMSDIGAGEGWTAMFSKGSYSGLLRLRLEPLSVRKARGQRGQFEIEADLREAFERLPGLRVTRFNFFAFGGNDVITEIYGDDLTDLQRLGKRLKERIEQVDNAEDVTFSLEEAKPEYGVYYDRQRLNALGMSTGQVSQAISAYFQGTLAGRYREAGWEYDIRVRAPRDYREDREKLERVPVATPVGQSVPLKTLADVRERVGPVKITRKDQQRMVTITSIVSGQNMGQVVADIDAVIEQLRSEEDLTAYSFKTAGSAEDFMDSIQWLGIALVVAVFLVYMVMASQFESLIAPFIIFFSIPLSIIGVVWILVLTDTALNVPALIGCIMLVGVVVNNAIVLVDFVNQMRRDLGLDVAEATYRAAMIRMRPVLMTAVTTILAMVPLALAIGEGSEGWAPMARVVVGGLAVSTLLTLVIIPVIYRLIEGTRERRRLRRQAEAS